MTFGANQKVVAAFDFDGTITTKDTFLPFLIRVFGWRQVATALIALAVPGIKVWLKISTRDHYKALLIGKLFHGVLTTELESKGREHAEEIATLYRPAALERIEWHRKQGHRLLLVSASLKFYLEPIAKQLGFDDLLCTEVNSSKGVCTGELNGENCRAAAKVRRLEGLLGDLNQYELYAYGDSDGDAEMLAAAKHAAFRPFHSSR